MDAKALVEEISSLTILMGILMGLLAGFLSDTLNPVGLIISAFSIRAVGLLMMPFVARMRFFLFICTLGLNVGNAVESVAVSYYSLIDYRYWACWISIFTCQLERLWMALLSVLKL